MQGFLIREWDADHPRWRQLMAFVAESGQSDWMAFRADFHKSSHVLVAIRDQNIVGFLRYVIQEVGPAMDRPPVLREGVAITEAKVLAFAVAQAHRRQGIGSALQTRLLQAARQ